MKKKFLPFLTMTLAIVMMSCGGNKTNGVREAQELSGAGATFPLRDKIVDFAGSDAFLTDKEMADMDPVVHIPTCMGAVVVAYNLDGVKDLMLTGEVIADIFAGEIKMWNDRRIAALNPDVILPNEAIIPVFRSDGSGTTFVFTDYLTKVSSMWKDKFGAGKSVNFPTGQAAKGNPGVAGVISNTRYSIGYVGSEYAFAQKIPYARIKNTKGEFVLPSSTTISAAASGVIPTDTRCSITNADAAGAYPISTFTWLIIYKEQNYSDRSKEQAEATIDLLKYILSAQVQNMTSEVNYAPLPAKARELSMKNLKTVTYNGVAILQ